MSLDVSTETFTLERLVISKEEEVIFYKKIQDDEPVNPFDFVAPALKFSHMLADHLQAIEQVPYTVHLTALTQVIQEDGGRVDLDENQIEFLHERTMEFCEALVKSISNKFTEEPTLMTMEGSSTIH